MERGSEPEPEADSEGRASGEGEPSGAAVPQDETDVQSGAPTADGDGTDADGTDSATDAGTHPFVFLVGLVLFLASTIAFVVDLATGQDVLRSLALNGLGVGIIVAWAAHDTLVDPGAEVSSVPGALGTAMLLLGIYLGIATVVLAISSPWHGRLGLWPWTGGTGVVLVVLGFATFPVEVLLGDDAESPPSE